MRLLVLFAALVCTADPSINPQSVEKFNNHWQIFAYRYFGCVIPDYKGQTAASVTPCYPAVGYTDLESFRQARDAAKVLFGLH